MIRAVAMLLGLLLSFSCCAGGPGAVRKTIEASMRVTGWVSIAADGSMTKLELDEKEKLPDGRGFADRTGRRDAGVSSRCWSMA